MMSISYNFDLNQVVRLELIGNGSFGEVYKVKDKKSNEIYAAKISFKVMASKDIIRDLSREVNILIKINHPSIIRFVGFSPINFHDEQKPVIVTEFLSNGTLYDIIELEKKGLSNKLWTDTRKLINIYGIAAAMSYLHAHNIIHRDLKPANILMDDFLFPKIADFGLSKIKYQNPSDDATQSTIAVKGTPIYMPPEVWSCAEYTTSCDVYSYGIIVYEIITNNDPFKGFNSDQIKAKIQSGFRPKIDLIPSESYQRLIEDCWQQDPNSRPTFDNILETLQNDPGFITDLVDEKDYYDYIEFIQKYPTTFTDKRIQIDQYITRKSATFKKVSINSSFKTESVNSSFKIKETKKQGLFGLFKKNKSKKPLYQAQDFDQLDQSCQQLIENAEDDADCQFKVGQYLMEGKNGFAQNTQLSVSYLKQSSKNGSLNAAVYYSRVLIKGEVIPQDLVQAKKLLKKHSNSENGDVLLLLGKIRKKEGNLSKAKKYFEKASKVGNAESMYEIGKMLYKGVGCTKNVKEATKLFNMAKKSGFDKSDKFLTPKLEESVPPPADTQSSTNKNMTR
ncbi:hypothetical protein M9Y10_030061 [Tritrichomonas musculus]|uniref:Protein kinase domain-containing protein n=1 Tax=Tritrichomonas musculus TaxID=1915356 RepID=A0ABR2KP82_9EUKA